MLKGLFRFIGVIVVIILLVTALLFYLDGKGLLFGRLGDLIHTLRILGNEAWRAISSFSQETGIVTDAQGLLSQGVDILENVVEPHAATASPDPYAATAVPTATPVGFVATASPVPTATPDPSYLATQVPTASPVPTVSPAVVYMG